MAAESVEIDPELLAFLVEAKGGELAIRMGIEFLEMSPTRSVATLPVEGNRQPSLVLNGGAHLVLGETLGSLSAALYGGPTKQAMGIEINATHSGAIATGTVTATCTAIKLGRTLCTHQVVVTDENGRLLSTVRITNILVDRH